MIGNECEGRELAEQEPSVDLGSFSAIHAVLAIL
jgi:hypothetical protein